MYLCSDGLPIDKSSQFLGYAGVTDEYQNRDNRMSNTFLMHGTRFWDNESATSRTTWTDADLENARTADVRSNSGYRPHKWAIERQAQDNFESMDFPVIRYAAQIFPFQTPSATASWSLEHVIPDNQQCRHSAQPVKQFIVRLGIRKSSRRRLFYNSVFHNNITI